MANYLLNLSIDPAAPASATGLFNDSSVDATSKQWYTIPAGWPSTSPTANTQVLQAASIATWGRPTADSHSLQCNLGDGIYIRVVPRSGRGWSSPTLQFGTVFGRTPGAGDVLAAPFVLNNNGPQALFANIYSSPSNPASGGDGSWIYYLGPLAQNGIGQKAGGGGSNPNRNLNYSFIVGATVSDGSVLCSYGHDPGMGVKG
jgi:hypothetical protein